MSPLHGGGDYGDNVDDDGDDDEGEPCLIVHLRHSHSKGKVTAGSVLPSFLPDVEGLHQAVTSLGHHQVHQSGCATCRT